MSTGGAFPAGGWNWPHIDLVRGVELLELCLHASKTSSCGNNQAQSNRWNADFFFLRRDSSVSLSLGYGLDYLGIGRRFLAKVRYFFLFSIAFRPTLEPIQPPIQRIPGSLSTVVKWSSREVDHLPPSNAGVEKGMELYFHSPCVFRGEHSDDFTFLPFPYDLSLVLIQHVWPFVKLWLTKTCNRIACLNISALPESLFSPLKSGEAREKRKKGGGTEGHYIWGVGGKKLYLRFRRFSGSARSSFSKSKSKLCYDRRFVGQSVLE
jgi:hypothetical protein